MDNTPLVSIIMPVWNAEKYIDEAVASVVAQTYATWELIIIDDGSTDTTVEKIAAWTQKDSRITSIKNTNEKGVAGALNSGLAVAKGVYIARTDADDINISTRLEKQVSFLEHHQDIAIVGSWYESFSKNNKSKIRRHPSNPAYLEWKFVSNTYFCHPSTMFRRTVLDTVPRYPSTPAEDFAFFSQAMHTHKGTNITSVLIRYREHPESCSQSNWNKLEASAYETYMRNYAHYGGPIEHIEAFYQFHAKYDLSIKDTAAILRTSNLIYKTIASHHRLDTLSRIMVRMRIITQIILALLIHYARAVRRYIFR
jgi:glycosyltransferase involved in cell wall biosynthesis